MPNLSTLVTNTIPPSSITTDKLAAGCVTPNRLSGGQTGNAPIYGCRAWVNFDGTTVNAQNECTIRASGNITKVVRTGTGSYTVYMTVPMIDINYAVSVMGKRTTVAGVWYDSTMVLDNILTESTFTIYLMRGGVVYPGFTGQVQNQSIISAAVFR
jgi:hypothetical protein